MKQSIPVGAIIAIIIVLVVALGFVGYKILGPQHGATTSAADMQKRFTEHNVPNSPPPTTTGGNVSRGYGGSGGYPQSGGSGGSGGYPRSGGGSGGYPSSGGR